MLYKTYKLNTGVTRLSLKKLDLSQYKECMVVHQTYLIFYIYDSTVNKIALFFREQADPESNIIGYYVLRNTRENRKFLESLNLNDYGRNGKNSNSPGFTFEGILAEDR